MFVTLDVNLYIAPANSGVILDFINKLIVAGANDCHFDATDDTNRFAIIINTTETTTSNASDRFILLINPNSIAQITLPILLYLNNAINWDAKNISINISPIPFKLLVNNLITDLLFVICLVLAAYIILQITRANTTIYKIPLTNGELAPNNLLT